MTADHMVPLAEPIRHGIQRSRGNWRNELLYLTMVGIEILWWIPWMIPLLPGANALRGSQIGALVAGHFLTALTFTRVLIRLRASDEVLRAAFFIGLIGALWLTLHYILPPDTLGAQPPAFAQGKLFFPPVLLITGFIIWFWLRGQSLAQATITPARAGFGLRIGILMLIGAALIPDTRTQRAVLTILPPFFFCGLLSLSLARAASFRLTREMQRSPFGAGWIGFVALVGGAISLIGFGAAFLFGGTSFQAIIDAFGTLFGGLLQLIATVFINLFGAIFERAGQLLGAVLTAIGDHAPTIVLSGPLADPLRRIGPQDSAAALVARILPASCVTLLLLFVLVFLLLTLRSRRRAGNRDGEDRESLSSNAILDSLKATVLHALDAAQDTLGNLNFSLGASDAITIRRLYARTCALAAQRGFPRTESQTPDEYQANLVEAFPDFRNEIELLTHAYVSAHYGELPDDPGLVKRVRDAVNRIAMPPRK